MQKTRLSIGAFAFAILCSSSANAQTIIATAPQSQITTSDGKTLYAPDFFAAYSPDNAREMVGLVPGFSIKDGGSVRGLAGASGNVLIDGTRPSSKENDLEEVLAAIPVNQIERIELLQGAAIGSLGKGHSVLVNIVRKTGSVASGNISLEAALSHHNIISPVLAISYGGKFRGFNYNVKIEGGRGQSIKRYGAEGLINNLGLITEFGPNFDRQQIEYGTFNTTIDGNIGLTKAKFDFNFTQYLEDRPWQVIATRTGQSTPYRVDNGRDIGRGPNIGFGAILERQIFGFDAKLNFIAGREIDDDYYDAGFNLISQPKRFTRFTSYSQVDEIATQIEMSKKYGNHNVSFGGETGTTRLGAESNFFINNGMGFVRDPDGNSITKVQETRSEAFIADTWSINPNLSLEGKLRNEWSRISQGGDKPKERDFSYLKPLLSLTYTHNPQLIFKAKYEKILFQLDFNDFAFSANLGDGSQNLGNSELRPPQIHNREISIEKKWATRGTLQVTYFDRDIIDVLTSVPVYENGVIIGEATGNIPDGKRIGVLANLTLPLDFIVKGLEVQSKWVYTQYEIIDPFTNRIRERPVEGAREFELEVKYNNETHKYSYGAIYSRGDRNASYQQFNSYLWPPASFWGVFGEYKGLKDYSFSANLELPNGLRIRRFRTDYLVSRADGQINGGHWRYRDLKPQLNISIRKVI